VGGDEDVVRADHISTTPESGSDLGIVQGRIAGEVDDRDVSKVVVKGCLMLVGSGDFSMPKSISHLLMMDMQTSLVPTLWSRSNTFTSL
jgi:hypothetical protein